MEKRISPESSALLHRKRHSEYVKKRRFQKEAAQKTDDEILGQIVGYEDMGTVFMSKRTSLRVKVRAYAREAQKRGLL